MKDIYMKITYILSIALLCAGFILTGVSPALAANINVEKDSDGNVTSITINGKTYSDFEDAAEALRNTGIASSYIDKILSGSYGSGSSQDIYYGNSTNLDDYTYMSRSDALELLNKYKNNDVYWGEEYIYYEGEPLTDFDNRIHGTFHTYSSYKDATHQGLSTSYKINDTYSGTHMYSVIIQTWDKKMNETQYNAAISKLEEIAAQYDYGSDLDKMQNIAQYFATSISYDYTKTFGDIYHAVYWGKGVCAAYAECFQLCMEYLGIESYIYTDAKHALNIVCLDGEYYYVDVTNMSDPNGVRWQFFLYGTNMRTNHTRLPISNSSYDGYTGNYGIDNIDDSERINSEDIKEFVSGIIDDIKSSGTDVAINESETENDETKSQTEAETNTQTVPETSSAETSTVPVTSAEQRQQINNEDDNSKMSVYILVIVCVVLLSITVIVTKKVNKEHDNNHES